MGNNYIVGIGEVLWDIFPDGKQLGGAPFNFAFHVSQLGYNGMGISAVGNDPLGDEIISTMDSVRLSYNIQKVEFPTGTVKVTLDRKGVPCYEITKEVAWDNIRFTRELEMIAMQTRVVCFGTLAQRSGVTRDTIRQFLDIMPSEDGYYRIFDINLRQNFYNEEIIKDSLWRCDILKINEDEIRELDRMMGYGLHNMQDICWKVMDSFNLGIIILTCGTEGSYVFSKGGITYRDTPVVEVADTVGAGDSFTAAFCVALLEGCSLEFAHDLAVDLSAYVCTMPGAMPRLPNSLKGRLKGSV